MFFNEIYHTWERVFQFYGLKSLISDSPNFLWPLLSKLAVESLVRCPTKWSLLLAFRFLWRSSSWWWQPHIAGCKLLWPLLRAGMTVFGQIFAKCILNMYHKAAKTFGPLFLCFTSPKETFFQLGVKCQNWGANVRIEEQRGNCNQIIAMINGR